MSRKKETDQERAEREQAERDRHEAWMAEQLANAGPLSDEDCRTLVRLFTVPKRAEP